MKVELIKKDGFLLPASLDSWLYSVLGVSPDSLPPAYRITINLL